MLGTYVFADNMSSPLLLLVMAFALTPVINVAVQGLQAQGLASSEFVTEKLPMEAQELGKGKLLLTLHLSLPLCPLQH